MAQRFVEVLGFYIQQKTDIPPTHRFLCKQINIHSQMCETTWQLKPWHQPPSEVPAV